MNKIQIFHNQRCSKSRCGLDIVKESGKEYEVIDYLNKSFTTLEVKALLKKLQMSPIELIRKNEAVWKELYQGKNLTDEQLIEAMVQHPKLIERPIIIIGEKAVLGRPPERITELLSNL